VSGGCLSGTGKEKNLYVSIATPERDIEHFDDGDDQKEQLSSIGNCKSTTPPSLINITANGIINPMHGGRQI
jgi:hypothetical protein